MRLERALALAALGCPEFDGHHRLQGQQQFDDVPLRRGPCPVRGEFAPACASNGPSRECSTACSVESDEG